MSRADSGRIILISKQRERAKEDIESQFQKLEEERRNMATAITTKFTTNVDLVEEKIKAATVGLVTLDEMKERQNEILSKADQIIVVGKREEQVPKVKASTEERKVAQKRILSFNFDDEEEEEVKITNKRFGMDPTVDTSFLPDQEREQQLIKEKEKLAIEWRQIQEKEKNEDINIAYCYWDGSSHRKDLKIKKGTTISQFIQKALEILRKEFTELKTITSDNMMFVKEDLIIPHFYTFHDFIVTKAMGITGPLWQFDAVGEIRLRQDAALDIGESHPAKICLRSWYEKNKHIYPASRWQAFRPGVVYKNTIEDLSTI